MNTIRTVCWMITCIAVVTLGACQSSPTRIHGLDMVVPAARMETYQAPPLRVDTVNVPAGWDRIEMLDVSAPGRLGINEFDHWSAPLAQITRQALSGDLDQRLPPGSVIYPRLPKPNGALGVDVDILEFGVAGLQASMQTSWTIVPPTGSQNAKRSVALLQVAMISTQPAAIAHAWSELLGQLADHIAADTASFNE